MPGRIDSHQHFWRYEAAAYPWIGADGFDRCIAVQARDRVEETGFLLDLADAHPWIAAVVGWIDLRSSDIERDLGRWAGRPALKGFRHLLQDEPEPQRDGHTLVLDHLAKPAVRERSAAARAAWRAGLRPVAALPHVVCKLSGLVTEARWRDGRLQNHPAADFHPYLDTALELFGPRRLMFGSDWPVCLLAEHHAGV